MKKLLKNTKYMILIAVVSLLLAALAAFLWGGVKTIYAIMSMVSPQGNDGFTAIVLIELMDTFLIATALFIFAIGLFELFIGDIAMPEWLVIHNLHDLKSKLSSVIILVLAVTYLKHLAEWRDPLGTLYLGISIALVSAALIAYGHFGHKD